MEPSRPAPPSSASGPRASLGRPRIFGGGTRRSTRIEKKSVLENERTKKQEQGSTEAEPEQDVPSKRARPSPEFVETQSSRKPKRKALTSERCLLSTKAPRGPSAVATNRDAVVDDDEDESRNHALYHTISEGGPRLKNIAQLIVEADTHENFRVPPDKIIANEDVDTRVCQQMRRLATAGNLTPERVRRYLIGSVEQLEACWSIRSRRPRLEFWDGACTSGTPGTWMNQIDGADCREFFICLLVYFRNGSGRKATNNFIKAFERLVELFEKEDQCELDRPVGVQQRLGQPANRSRGRGRSSAAVSRGAAPKKRASQTVREDGNIFHWSGDTNMSDFELSGIDVQGLTPVVDVGDRRRKHEAYRRAFDDYVAKLNREKHERNEQKEAAAPEAASTSMARSTMQGSKRSSRMRPAPSQAPQTNQQKDAMAGRAFYEFDEGEEANAGDEEERRMAAALKRQRLLERHAARGGPTSD